MTWIASTPTERRAQLGPFLLGTGGIGGIALETGPGIGLSEQEGLDLIDRAVDREGVKVLDTADVYAAGASERVVGRWSVARASSDTSSDVLIQSKTGITADGPDLSPDRIATQLRSSIAVLGHVDLYLTHRVDPRTPWSASLQVLSDAVERGDIRAYGVSNVTAEQLQEALDAADRGGLARPEIVQNAYSLLVRDDEAALLPLVQAEGLAYTPYSPLANGLLAGKYSRGEAPGQGSRADNAPRARGLLAEPGMIDRLARFDELAVAQGTSAAGLALAWLLSRPAVTGIIAGISKESHWAGLHDALAVESTPALTEQLDAIFPNDAA